MICSRGMFFNISTLYRICSLSGFLGLFPVSFQTNSFLHDLFPVYFRWLATFYMLRFHYFQNRNFLHDLVSACCLLASNFLHDLFPSLFSESNFFQYLFSARFVV